MRDLDEYRNLRRPALSVEVGDEVVIADNGTRDLRRSTTRGRVEKVGPVWITVSVRASRTTGKKDREYRFHRDTQSQSESHGGWGGLQFATLEQHKHDLRVIRAWKVLIARNFVFQPRSKQLPDGQLIAVAELLTELEKPAKKPIAAKGNPA